MYKKASRFVRRLSNKTRKGIKTVDTVVNPGKTKPKADKPLAKVGPIANATFDKTPLELHMTDEVFASLMSWGWHYAPKECAGFGRVVVVDETIKLDWVWVDVKARMSTGSVESSEANLFDYCIENDVDITTINLQWHTHPFFSPYWSSTDLRDQNDLAEWVGPFRKGQWFYFLVHNMREVVVRGVQFGDNGKVEFYRDGHVIVRGTPFKRHYTGTATVKDTGVKHWSTYDGWDDVDDDWPGATGWSRKTAKYEQKELFKYPSVASQGMDETWYVRNNYIPSENGWWYPRDSAMGQQILKEMSDADANTDEVIIDLPTIAFDIPADNFEYAYNMFPPTYRAKTVPLAKANPHIKTSDFDFAFIGWWSDRYEDYDELFRLLRVPRYNFRELARVVDSYAHQPIYFELIQRPSTWLAFVKGLTFAESLEDLDDLCLAVEMANAG